MTSRDFCFWLQGYFEISGAAGLSVEQAEIVRKHLGLVFVHEIDPSAGPPAHQATLDAINTTGAKPRGKWRTLSSRFPPYKPTIAGGLLRC